MCKTLQEIAEPLRKATQLTLLLMEAVKEKELIVAQSKIPKCSCCRTNVNLHRDLGSGGPYRCGSRNCVVF